MALVDQKWSSFELLFLCQFFFERLFLLGEFLFALLLVFGFSLGCRWFVWAALLGSKASSGNLAIQLSDFNV
jgi:hypothetical protein